MGPLISCLMPTFNRRAFVVQTIADYQRQVYLPRELLILDDGESVADLVPTDDPSIRYLRCNPIPCTDSYSACMDVQIGSKRRTLVGEARGELIALWDDDDRHAPERLEVQVSALLARPKQRICFTNTYAIHEATGRWYIQRPRQARQLDQTTVCWRPERDIGNLGPMTLALHYGEDATVRIDRPDLYLYRIHKDCTRRGIVFDPKDWTEVTADKVPLTLREEPRA